MRVLPVPVAGGVRMVMVRLLVQSIVDAAVGYLFSVSARATRQTDRERDCDYFQVLSVRMGAWSPSPTNEIRCTSARVFARVCVCVVRLNKYPL